MSKKFNYIAVVLFANIFLSCSDYAEPPKRKSSTTSTSKSTVAVSDGKINEKDTDKTSGTTTEGNAPHNL